MGQVALVEDRYEGTMPGIAEEAILTLERGRTYVPLGAFGGATRDVAIALDLLTEDHRVPRGPQIDGYQEALGLVAGLRDRVGSLRPALATLATSDRAEEIGVGIVDLLAHT